MALVANLPYAVAATVVLRFFEEMPELESATVMVQSEVADRMAAGPGGKDYGAYTVKLRMFAEPAGRFPVPRGLLHAAAARRLGGAATRARRAGGAARPRRRGGTSRRGRVRPETQDAPQLHPRVRRRWPDALDAALARTGIDGRRRAETLSVEEYLLLAGHIGTARDAHD